MPFARTLYNRLHLECPTLPEPATGIANKLLQPKPVILQGLNVMRGWH